MQLPQGRFLGIGWTDAAIIAAVVSGVFVLVKEGLSFLFRLREEQRQLKRMYRDLYARVWHDYFQMGIGVQKAFLAWQSFYDDVASSGSTGVAGASPHVGFLFRHDQQLATDVLQLTDQSPETVTAYLHAVTIREHASRVVHDEEREFGSITFSYPRTQNVLRHLLEHAANSLEELAEHLPGKPWWRRKAGLREACRNCVVTFRTALEPYPRISKEEVLRTNAEARQRLQAPPTRLS